jgi:hypothetical protein
MDEFLRTHYAFPIEADVTAEPAPQAAGLAT